MSFFVGIAFDQPTRAAFAQALELARRHADAKWTPVDKAHLTLVFLAETPLPDAALARVAALHAPLQLRLRGAGTFRDQVLWLGVGGELDALRALQASFGVPSEHGEYAPHVTLARAKKRRDQRFRDAAAALADFESPAFTVRELTHFESRGGRYVVRETAPLR